MKTIESLILFCFLFGLISSLTTENTIIKDINYNEEYELDKSVFTEENMDLCLRFYLTSITEELSIEFKTLTEERDDLGEPKINIYTEKPSDEDIKNADKSTWDTLFFQRERKFKDYTYFTYILDNIKNNTFSVVTLPLNKKYKYFSILLAPLQSISKITGKINLNQELILESNRLKYTLIDLNFNILADIRNKNGDIIINLSENDINDLVIKLKGYKNIDDYSTLIEQIDNYSSSEKNEEKKLISYRYNFGKIPNEYPYVSVEIKSKDNYMLYYFSILVKDLANLGNFISFRFLSIFGSLLLIL